MEEDIKIGCKTKRNNYDISVDYIDIGWNSNIGFGHITLKYDEETRKWDTDTECMGKEFVEKVIEFLNNKVKPNISLIEEFEGE